MPVILHVETSTNVCSIAVSENGKLIFEKSNKEGLNHAKLLSPFINEALVFLSEKGKKLEAIAVSSGPGSYTGLRIGVSTAKGLCYGMDIPLISVSTLEIISIAAKKVLEETLNVNLNSQYLFCPMIDARRMEVYSAFFNNKNKLVKNISADIITENSYSDILEVQPVYFFGNGAEKCKPLLKNPSAHFLDNIEPLAENMIILAEKKFKERKFEDVAYFEPFYLKEFFTTMKI
jgi:tRNA threonylcarbamoyladenosine biosynthesis protein TsaB